MAAHLSPDPSPGPSVEDILMQVDRDNVLDVHRAVVAEYERLHKMWLYRSYSFHTFPECGADPVSKEASAAFGRRIRNLLSESKKYNLRLHDVATALAHAARQYGCTEDEILAATAQPAAVATDLSAGFANWLKPC